MDGLPELVDVSCQQQQHLTDDTAETCDHGRASTSSLQAHKRRLAL